MRDLLGLLRKHPDLYRSACRQAVPSVHFDWLAIVNKARGLPARGACACPRVGLQLPQCQDAATAVHCQADGDSAAYDKGTAVAAVPRMLFVPSLDITVFDSTTPCSQSCCLRQLEPRTPKVVCTCGGERLICAKQGEGQQSRRAALWHPRSRGADAQAAARSWMASPSCRPPQPRCARRRCPRPPATAGRGRRAAPVCPARPSRRCPAARAARARARAQAAAPAGARGTCPRARHASAPASPAGGCKPECGASAARGPVRCSVLRM